MIKKKVYLLLISILFNFCSKIVFAQDITRVSNPVVDSTGQQKSYNEHYLKPSALIIPGTFLLYGGLKPFISAIPKLDNNIMAQVQQKYPGFHTNASDYITWAPSASLYLMDALKVRTIHNFREHLIIDAGSIIITGGIGYGMRLITRNIKVYNTNGTDFPSAHTANAFRGAEILHQELKETNKLLSYSGYVFATSVGVLRIYNKDHLLSEVLAGAGLGIISAKLTYLIFDKVKYKIKRD